MAMTLLDPNSSTTSSLFFSPVEKRHNVSVNRTSSRQYHYPNIIYVDFYLHEPLVSAIFIVSYLLIFIVCMVGNGVVCFIVLRSKNMSMVTNLFILNLALLVGIFCMPTTLVDNIITVQNIPHPLDGNTTMLDKSNLPLLAENTREEKQKSCQLAINAPLR